MNAPKRIITAFHEGDRVRLAEGTYQGNQGVFLRLRADPNWADIVESGGLIRCHPVAWLALRTPAEKIPRSSDSGSENQL